MNRLPTLYKFDTKGKVRRWDIYSENNTFVVRHGLDGGKIQEKITPCKAKNIGKANETTPDEQAIKEAKAKWLVQIQREDYSEDIQQSGLQTRPMLALDYLKVPHRVDFTRTVAQPKLDGLRLVSGLRWSESTEIELMTRKGENYDIPHFTDPIAKLLGIVQRFTDLPVIGLDGEAYIHGMKLQKIISLARKNQPTSSELLYHLFDLIIFDMTFEERHKILTQSIREYESIFGTDHPFILVINHPISSEEEMKECHDRFVGDGFEGCILRHIDSMYTKGRSADLFKYKHFFDDETLIIGMFEDNNGNAMLVVRLKNGLEQNLTPKRTHKVRKQMLKEPDEWIGKWINTRYQDTTDEGKLTFATGRDLRDCDEDGNPLI